MGIKEFGEKIQKILDKQFHKIFNNSHFLYTIIFLICSLLISLLSLIPNAVVGNLILFLATVLAITFILLMFEGLIPQLNKYLFNAEKKFDKWKFVVFIINFFISFFIILPYFMLATSTKIPIQFLGWDVILPALFIIIYFGWNLVQIFFIRKGFDSVSDKLNEKVISKYGSSSKKNFICLIFMILALVVPFLILLGTFFGFFSEFSAGFNRTLFIACNVIVLILFIIASWRFITLYQRSKKINATNSFSSMFYLLIWILLWFRVLSFFNALKNATQATQQLDIISGLLGILLLVFTSIMVLRGLGEKVYDSFLFNSNNMPFFLFAFTILYIEGQIIMITGAGTLAGIFADKNQINLINNFLIILITIIFYWWYSEHSLERKGYLMRKSFYPVEVASLLTDFREFLVNDNIIVAEKIEDEKIDEFLRSKHIEIQKPEEIEDESEIQEETGSGNNT
ncbi:MAG: hypothetical protein ACFFCV_16730 [Promethearchaeota archaeon]